MGDPVLVLLAALGLMVAGGLASMAAGRRERLSSLLGAGSAVAGCALGLVPAARAALGLETGDVRWAWDLPGAGFHVGLDALSGFFLVPTLGLTALAAVYGVGYLKPTAETGRPGPARFYFNLLGASMALVLVSRDAVLFLLAWETMALSSFFLVTFENGNPKAREAGWVYLVASHLGTAFLLAMFVLIEAETGTLDFDGFGGLAQGAPAAAGLIFLLALVGFGTKAGFMPLHVWLPDAHPAAPSHVSAVLSGVMIKTGIYGLVRTMTFLGTPPEWWGWTLVAIGATSGVLGVLFALAQHDLKRLLAYHSVENIGIICLGLGLGVLGLSRGNPVLAALGFGGGLLHVFNHAMFKGLLFLGAGSVLHAAGTRDLEHLGGLLKRMPWTGAAFLVGAAAITGLPPLNGFVSEFLIFLGAFHGLAGLGGGTAVFAPALLVVAALALIGGLAAACFAKAFGIVFLGEPRGEAAARAKEAGLAMRIPMAVLAAGCAAVGLLPFLAVRGLRPAAEAAAGLPAGSFETAFGAAEAPLTTAAIVAGVFLALAGGLAILRRRRLPPRKVEEALTWDCGYARPTARMQYTASSFAKPLTTFFRLVLRTRRTLVPPRGLFPREASLHTETGDVCRETAFEPLFAAVEAWSVRLRVLQQGRIQVYVLYIVATLVILLAWEAGVGAWIG